MYQTAHDRKHSLLFRYAAVMVLIAILSHTNTDMTTTALFMITTQSEYTNSTYLLQAIVIEGPGFTHCMPRSTLVIT